MGEELDKSVTQKSGPQKKHPNHKTYNDSFRSKDSTSRAKDYAKAYKNE